MQRLADGINNFFEVNQFINSKITALDLAKFLAKRFNGTSLYISINEDKEQRNKKVLKLRSENKSYNEIANILGISKSMAHAIVSNKSNLILTGEFNEN